MMFNRQTAFACVAICLGSPAAAEFKLPDGCIGFLTVQSKMCQLTHHYTCKGDPKGHQWRIDIDDRGPVFVSQIDAETRWIYSFDMTTGTSDRLVEDSKDHANFTTLARDGYDDFDFLIKESTGRIVQVTGVDRLTGETVVIDDMPLMVADSQATATNDKGEMIWSVTGQLFVDPNRRFFLSGAESWTYPDQEPFQIDTSPLEFFEPGDVGFLAEVPKFECSAELVKFEHKDGDTQ